MGNAGSAWRIIRGVQHPRASHRDAPPLRNLGLEVQPIVIGRFGTGLCEGIESAQTIASPSLAPILVHLPRNR